MEELEDSHREAAQACDVLWPMTGANGAAIFVVIPVNDVMDALDASMAAINGQNPLWRGFLRRAAGDPQRSFAAKLAGFFLDGFPLDQKDLSDVREV